jgi:DNA-binding NtrC family response regulator
VANTTAGVLIQGEPGTGKELLARFIHGRSRRRNRPFVAVNCTELGALAEHSVERELFGVDAPGLPRGVGAYTGKLGQATGGTLFLDEIGDLSASAQAKVLRVLEEQAIERLGGRWRVPVDVRLIAATSRPLEEAVAARLFRGDLYYRVAVIVLKLPPLRERGDDVRMLAEHFVGSFACANNRYDFAIATETLSLLQAHPWPGNVRQMKETLERAASTADGPLLLPADLPPDARDTPRLMRRWAGRGTDVGSLQPLDELEWRHIQDVLSMTGGDLEHTAMLLGVGPMALGRRLRRYRTVH